MVEGAEPHGFDGILGARKGRQHHDGRRALLRADAAQHLDAIHAGHVEIE